MSKPPRWRPLSGGFNAINAGGVDAVLPLPSAEVIDTCCPPSPPPVTVPLVCPEGSSSSGDAPDVGPDCGFSHYEPACCKFLATPNCSVASASNTFTSLCSGTVVTPTQMACIVAASVCTTPTIEWKPCGSGVFGPCTSIKTAPNYCVTLRNGTGAYIATYFDTSVAATVTPAGLAFSFTAFDRSFTISGTLVWCCSNGVTKLKFQGRITSTVDVDGFPCGCVFTVDNACATSDDVELVTDGPNTVDDVFDSETLHLSSACGSLDLVIEQGDCPTPPPDQCCAIAEGTTVYLVIIGGTEGGIYTTTIASGQANFVTPFGARIVACDQSPGPGFNKYSINAHAQANPLTCGPPVVAAWPAGTLGTGDMSVVFHT